jgi:hypothetical protein
VPVFAGIAGIESEVGSYDFGRGITLKKTYAHLMAPYLMAFKEAEPGKAHPGPWRAVHGGREIDISLELYIPPVSELMTAFDRLNTAWWIISLIRLRGYDQAYVPVVSNRAFSEIPGSVSDTFLVPVEMMMRSKISDQKSTCLMKSDLDWIKQSWLPGANLMRISPRFNAAYQQIDNAGLLSSRLSSLLNLWGALEHLFSSPSQEIRFRISAYIAAYIEPAGNSRLELYKELCRQYDARCKAAHGETVEVESELAFMFKIVQRVVEKIFAHSRLPSKDEVETLLFIAGEKWIS